MGKAMRSIGRWRGIGLVRGRRGTSLVEVLTTLAVMGVLVSILAPPMRRLVVVTRVHGAARVVRADLSYARMLAVRTGHGAVVRFVRDPGCAWAGARGGRAYTVESRGPSLPGRGTTLRMLEGRVCYAVNNGDSLVFTSRGLLAPFQNRTVWTAEDDVRDSVTISVAGRVFHREP